MSALMPVAMASQGNEDTPVIARQDGDAAAASMTGVSRDADDERDRDTLVASGGSDGIDDPAEEMERRASIVQSLARSYSNTTGVDGGNPFLASENSALNPNSPQFSGRAWAKALVNLVSRSGGTFRTAGVAFQNLNVYGYGRSTDYQKDIFNLWLSAANLLTKPTGQGKTRIDILRDFDGIVRKGEMLVVLGPPGSGCSTFLKTIACETNGIWVDDTSYLNYQGITPKEMHSHHRGEAIYTAEVDVHFPMLSVGDTLTFASRARRPRTLPEGIHPDAFASHLRDVVMAMFGISHTVNTRVGNDFIRGVSGGERKRVTIAEAALTDAPLQCWDNSTRGLDSANAIEFCRTLRLQADMFNNSACVSIYQAPQTAYDLFDKVSVLYEGRQIFFGPTTTARQYFIDLGFEFPLRATTPDFLTSMTSPQERIVRKGWEDRAPRSPDEFAHAWKTSVHYRALQDEIEEYKKTHPLGGADAEAFRASKKAQQARGQRAKSPYTLSYLQQIDLTMWRGWKRLIGDPSITLSSLIGNAIMGLIVSSVFYNLEETTDSFFQRGSLLFFAMLLNGFSSILEINTLYAQRPIVEKHARYALYHPSAEAFASMACDLPNKILNAIIFNLVLYFIPNLNREPGAFFFFLLISFFTVLNMSMIFRTIASLSRSLAGAMVPAAILILALIMFTGFVIPIDYMLGWSRWINYINPLAYAFDALMSNEFHGRDFRCTNFVPNPAVEGYANVSSSNRVCSSVGSVAGLDLVNGDAYIRSAFSYEWKDRWRNFGILVAFMFFFLATYLVAAELVSEKKSKGEVLVFRRGHKPAVFKEKHNDDPEDIRVGPVTTIDRNRGNGNGLIEEQKSVFHWNNVCYDIQIKGETRRILDNVDGWVKPGTLTALMGVSGAGKTTLLDVLADRKSVGVITGDMLVDGYIRDAYFQRKTGYVQQQDLHLQTSTVREALNFSALLRQPDHIPRQEKLEYVEEVIKLLDAEEFADAVIGAPGEGLNVEQRKRLTIGIELVAKPPLLLFVDEPTSGLDSQTSWAILDLLEKLTKNGQAVLCTIHQPSAMLFQRFDRLLFLAKGGKTVYFGDVDKMTTYFEQNGGFPCPQEENPAEWMLQVIGAAPGSSTEIDWHDAWRNSPEYQSVQDELKRLKDERNPHPNTSEDTTNYREFAASYATQLREVTFRVFQQYWRTPTYIYSKAALCITVALFVGFSFFKAPNSIQGLQNQQFSIFSMLIIFSQLAQQTMPHFVTQRSLYEARERPSKIYSWKIFMLSQIIAELPWNSLMSVFMYLCWYYPVGLYRNAEPMDQVHERGALVFLYLLVFLLHASTFTDLIIAGFEAAEVAMNVFNLFFTLSLVFCGILASPDVFPRFWIFLYRASPFTYFVSGLLSSAVANTNVVCADNELLSFDPPAGQTCGEYMAAYINTAGGYLQDLNATVNCQFCSIDDTNVYLAGVRAPYSERWRNLGILLAYIVANVFGALAIYWLARMPKKGGLFGKKKKD
ncbi:ABC-2 type transporter-domain-containing protein [Dactylonectria macrodidyma]|uniref:ABC-2 type transporter-domain-containing protein n=1 Tax=Dactylonectria macrodidyma TaxID=307937 RepID=A0A9P9EHX3_9HYPO|nr:ABC-2 type transporter-domain-containing protein [Dactylonectria macrodidyma]